MARWTVAEAIKALKDRDKDAREDIGRTCPLFVTATYEEILEAIDVLTARQVEARLRQILGDGEEEEEAVVEKPKKRKKREVEEEEPKKKKKKKVVEEEEQNEEINIEEVDFLDDIFDDE